MLCRARHYSRRRMSNVTVRFIINITSSTYYRLGIVLDLIILPKLK